MRWPTLSQKGTVSRSHTSIATKRFRRSVAGSWVVMVPRLQLTCRGKAALAASSLFLMKVGTQAETWEMGAIAFKRSGQTSK
jgi:hypothetical protein